MANKMNLAGRILLSGIGLFGLLKITGCMSDETWEQVKAHQEYQQKVRDAKTNQYTDEERIAAEKRADEQLKFMIGIYSGALQRAGGDIITHEYIRKNTK